MCSLENIANIAHNEPEGRNQNKLNANRSLVNEENVETLKNIIMRRKDILEGNKLKMEKSERAIEKKKKQGNKKKVGFGSSQVGKENQG